MAGAKAGENYHDLDVYGGGLNANVAWALGKTAVGFDISKECIYSTALGENIIQAFTALHEQGFAASVEVWDNETDELVGGLGSDAAIEAADVVLMDDDPRKIALAVKIARRTIHIAHENVIFAIGVKVAVLILATIGLGTMWMAVFADVGVTVSMTLRLLLNKINIMWIRRCICLCWKTSQATSSSFVHVGSVRAYS